MPIPAECAAELRVAYRPVVLDLLLSSTDPLNIDCKQYSSMQRLLRVTAHVLRYVCNLKNRIMSGSCTIKEDATTSEAEHLASAEAL